MGACFTLFCPKNANSYSNNYYSVGICSMRGLRKSMQDRYSVCLSLNNHPGYSFFGVFDGFNGNEAATYLSNHLVETLNSLKYLHDHKLIINTINKMDKMYLKQAKNGSGSTLVFALIHIPHYHNFKLNNIPSTDPLTTQTEPDYLVSIYWVGDSPALLIKDNNYEKLTTDHHYTFKNELKRITKAGGKIINKRIDGITTLSRSFGCHSMKNNEKLKSNEQKHISVAEYKQILCKSNDHLLLFSDGFTEKWSLDMLVKKYNRHYNQQKSYANPLQYSLNYLIEDCIDEGSYDNITAISIKFK